MSSSQAEFFAQSQIPKTGYSKKPQTGPLVGTPSASLFSCWQREPWCDPSPGEPPVSPDDRSFPTVFGNHPPGAQEQKNRSNPLDPIFWRPFPPPEGSLCYARSLFDFEESAVRFPCWFVRERPRPAFPSFPDRDGPRLDPQSCCLPSVSPKRFQKSFPPMGTSNSGWMRTTFPTPSGTPSVKTSERCLPICRGAKLTTHRTCLPTKT